MLSIDKNFHEGNFCNLKRTIVQSTVNNIRALIEDTLPQTAAQHFLLWILAPDNKHREDYLQITGILKIAELSAFLLYDLFDSSFQEKISFYLGALNCYFFFEIVSDNLAIGLAGNQKSNRQMQSALYIFNEIMQQKLLGDDRETCLLISPMADKIRHFSIFDQSLFPSELLKLFKLYNQNHVNVNDQNLQYNLLDYLILNIEACLKVTQYTKDPLIKPILVKSFCSRYAANSALLRLDKATSLELLIDYGTQTILIIPVLLYILSSINNIMMYPNWQNLMQSGLLYKAIETASRLIRIVNDIGTQLINSTQDELKAFQRQFIDHCQNAGQNGKFSFLHLLSSFSENERFADNLTRIRKDIKYNEFNICLDNVRFIKDGKESCDLFFNNLKVCCEIYKQQRLQLLLLLEEIDNQVRNENISLPILRIVEYHEKLYENSFENSSGEFATKK